MARAIGQVYLPQLNCGLWHAILEENGALVR